MHILESKIENEIVENGIVSKGDHLLLAVSGGSDSVGLFYLLAALQEKLDLSLTAVYVDHGLRPEETRGERVLVEGAAAELGTGFCSGVVNVRNLIDEKGLSVEEAARDLRYGFLEEAAQKYNCTKIAVAHTADDQAEELLLRLIRGTGRSGLSGMGQVNFRNVIRPLLKTSKADICAYLADRNVSYLEDSSNKERSFLRNRVRLDLLPYIAENFNPSIRETLLRTADILGVEEEVLVRLTGEVYDRVVNSEEGPDYFVIDCPALACDELAIQRRVVERVLTNLSSPVTFNQVEKIIELVKAGNDGAELHLSEGLRVIRKSKAVLLFYPAGRTRERGSLLEKAEDFQIEIDSPGTFPVQGLSMELVVSVSDEVVDKKELMSGLADYLDMGSFEFPLQVRPPKPGDRFRPLGGPGSRKVADFLSDQKMPKDDRRRLPVLVKDDDVLALLGLRIDDRYKLLETTGNVLKVEIKPFTGR